MPKNDIGGFFVSLGLNIDKNSWETGNRIIDGMGNSLNKLIGTARNAAVVLAGTAIATGTIESAAYKTSVALGVTTEKLNLWKASAKIAGVSADGIVAAMTQIANVQNRLKWDDSGIEAFSKKLGKLKISYEEIKDLSSDKALEYILTKAQKLEGGDMTTAEIATAVGDIVGTGGRDFYIELQRQGKSVPEFLAGAQRTQLTTAQDNQNGQNFMTEVNTLKVELQSMSTLLGDSLGAEFTEYLKKVNEFIQEHGSDIADGINTIAENVGKVVEKIVGTGQAVWPTVKAVGKAAGESVEGTYNGVKNMVTAGATGDLAGLGQAAVETFDAAIVEPSKKIVGAIQNTDWAKMTGSIQTRTTEALNKKYANAGWWAKAFGSMDFSELPQDLQDDIKAYRENVNKGWTPSSRIKNIHDGIISPNGTVTEVAPDDWVLAARSLGDMARAFIPQNYTAAAAPSEYVINQTFNISGGNDMPQVLRQQAYRGTQEGLLEIMNQSSQRMQLMSGTR